MSKLISAHAFVQGSVQGVGFRHWTFTQAQALGLTGWVRNLSDGRVEAFFEGPNEIVREMLEKLHEGPRFSRVDGVSVETAECQNTCSDFQVRR